MIYLFLGSDLPAKDAKISEIKNKFFKDSQEALAFDLDNLDARELGENTLKQAFLTLPVIAPHRTAHQNLVPPPPFVGGGGGRRASAGRARAGPHSARLKTAT